jgi:hypothetical protein
MHRRLILGIALLIVALGLPAMTLAAQSSPFTGTWTSTDYDGSHQTLVVSAGARPSVVYQDFYANGCDTFGGPATHWVAAGAGTVDAGVLYAAFHKSGCGSFLQGGYEDWFAYEAGDDTLTDSFGIVWTRS